MQSVLHAFVATIVSILVSLVTPVEAAAFGKRYSAPPGFNPWRGQLKVLGNTTNYWLTASGLITNNNARQTVHSVGLVRGDGAVDWALSATQGVTGQLSLRPVANQPLVFAKLEGLPDEDYWTVFGLFNARNGTPVFELGIPVTLDETGPGPYFVPDPVSTIQLLADGRCAITLEGQDETVRLALLDGVGKPLWQKALTAPSFSRVTRGARSSLIENPGKGFWLLVQGSQRIFTGANPPPINTAVTLNLVRLNDQGEVLWTRRLAGLLTGAPELALGPAAILPDETIVLALTDTIFNTVGTPALLDVVTYLIGIGPEGNLRWAHRIPRVALTTPVATTSSIYVIGQKLPSLTAVFGDNVIMRFRPDTGTLMNQTSVPSASALNVTPIGFASGKLFVHAFTRENRALVGALNTSLNSGVFGQFGSSSVHAAELSFHPGTGNLLFSASPTGGTGIEAFTLNMDLDLLASDPPVPCEPFLDLTIPLVNPEVRLETLVLTPTAISLSEVDTDLSLVPSTLIALRPVLPNVEDICPVSLAPATDPVLAGERSNSSLTISFSSETDRVYELLFTTSLQRSFQPLNRIHGNGKQVQHVVDMPKDQNGFFAIRAVRP